VRQGEKDLIERVRRLSRGRVGSRQSIALLLLSEGSGLARLSMAEVAQLSYTSKPSLVRFAQALGFPGWTDFQEAFVQEALAAEGGVAGDIDPNFPFGATTPTTEVVSRVAGLERHALDQVLASLDEDALQAAARRIVSARQVVYFGVFQNRYFGKSLAHHLGEIDISCLVPSPKDAALVARGMGPEDCAIVVSYSGLGEGRPPSVFVPTLLDHGVPVVAVTNSGDNWLRHHAGCVLAFPPEEHLYSKVGGFYSETATTLVLQVLLALCFQVHYDQNVQRKLGAVVESERLMQTSDILPG